MSFSLVSSVQSLRSGYSTLPGYAWLREAKRGRHVLHFFGKSSDELQDTLDKYISVVNSYEERDIVCMPTNWSILLTGMKAGLKLPLLLKAVRVLYVDMLPLRVGADFLMKAINEMVKEGNQKVKQSIPDADLTLASTLFDVLDVDGSGTISESNLQAIGLTPSAIADIMDAIDIDGNHQIDRFEFMADRAGDNEPDVFNVLIHVLTTAGIAKDMSTQDIEGIVNDMRLHADNSGSNTDGNEAKFNEILQFITDLEPKLENRNISNNRMKSILDGSLEAAKDPEVVAALRFVYSQIGPIRVAGDLIYGLVKRFMAS
eukprot:CAMPEP_0172772548 /NCGR_PEP_ID=MMETSP1074-20121228/192582_1 /TAXON_ID=2916 /ORGANISM="Ceratium fusus, Strain PA161109" /LENGTH=315 /DNA_ID=CAMNT_0013608679 /DNA_START=74 /DNA_END=1021 /DNA_ORIENTATION=+